MVQRGVNFLELGETCSTFLASCGAKVIWIRQPLVTQDYFTDMSLLLMYKFRG